MLEDRVGMTFRDDVPFTVSSGHPYSKKVDQAHLVPFNEDTKYFRGSKYFYDTPEAIYKDQILTLLTTEELLKTIPREIITPRTFSLRPLQSLFLAGLGRIDVVTCQQNVWLTVVSDLQSYKMF